MKKNQCINCAECGFAELCSAYLFHQPDSLFIRHLETKRKIPRGEYISRQGENVHAIYALRSGIAKVYNAQEQLLSIVLPGQIIGVEDLHSGRYLHDIKASTETEVCVLNSEHFYEMSQLLAGFTDYIVRVLSRSAQEKQQLISVLTKSDALLKVHSFLQLLSAFYKEYGFEYRNIELPVSKKELAQLLGISISTLSRCLEKLCEQNIVAIENKKEITLLATTQS